MGGLLLLVFGGLVSSPIMIYALRVWGGGIAFLLLIALTVAGVWIAFWAMSVSLFPWSVHPLVPVGFGIAIFAWVSSAAMVFLGKDIASRTAAKPDDSGTKSN